MSRAARIRAAGALVVLGATLAVLTLWDIYGDLLMQRILRLAAFAAFTVPIAAWFAGWLSIAATVAMALLLLALVAGARHPRAWRAGLVALIVLPLAACAANDPGLRLMGDVAAATPQPAAGAAAAPSPAVEIYKLYARRCSSQFSVPWAASVTCERLQDDAAGATAQAKVIAAAVADAVRQAVREAFAEQRAAASP